MQNSNIELTWDQEDAERAQAMKRRFTKEDLEKMDFSAYLASSASENEEEEDPETIRRKYNALLYEDNEKTAEEKEDMEITFTSGLTDLACELIQRKHEKELGKNGTLWEKHLLKKKQSKKLRQKKKLSELEFQNDDSFLAERLELSDPYFKDALKDYKDELPELIPKVIKKKKVGHEHIIEQEKTQRVKEKAELELLMMNEESTRHNHFSMEKVLKDAKKKLKKKVKNSNELNDADTFDMNIVDPRFSALYESSEYAIDPTNPL